MYKLSENGLASRDPDQKKNENQYFNPCPAEPGYTLPLQIV